MFVRYVLALSVLFLVTPAPAQEPPVDPADCGGVGRGALLLKGTCVAGSSVKVKMAGEPRARFVLLRDRASAPVEVPGLGTFCLEFGPDRTTVARGRLNGLGFRSLFTTLPDDPALLGEMLAFQMAAEDDNAPNGVAVSNAYFVELCEEATEDDCEAGIRRLGYVTVVPYDGPFPVPVSTRLHRAGHPDDQIGEVSFDFDPGAPPVLPLAADDLTVTRVDAFPGMVVIHSVAKGCDFANGRLFNESLFATEVGDVEVSVQIHTSCSVPIGPGSRFPPVFITSLQDVGSAPPGDCD